MATYTSSLPDSLLERLNSAAKDLRLPKNKIIERALSLFLDEYKRTLYAKSFKRASNDPDMLEMAEEGMSDYLKQLKTWDETS